MKEINKTYTIKKEKEQTRSEQSDRSDSRTSTNCRPQTGHISEQTDKKDDSPDEVINKKSKIKISGKNRIKEIEQTQAEKINLEAKKTIISQIREIPDYSKRKPIGQVDNNGELDTDKSKVKKKKLQT